MKKIAHLTSVHPRYDTRFFFKECRSLSGAGYQIFLVVADGKGDEVNEGISIFDVGTNKGRINRIVKVTSRVFTKAKSLDADLYHFHDPELMPVGMLLRLHGKKVIYDVHEDYPGSILDKFWLPSLLRKPISLITACIEWISSQFFFTAIVAVTSTIANRFPEQKTVLVQNFPQLQELVGVQNKKYGERAEHIAYIGGIAEIRSIFEIMEAMEMVSHENCKLKLAGIFSNPDTEKKCKEYSGWKKVEYQGWVSRKEVAGILEDVQAGLVLFHPLPNHTASQPNKLFEYMSAGIPVIASDFPLWRKIIDGAQCGLLVDPLQPKAIAEAIDWLLDHPAEAEQMGKNGRKAVVEQYNWETESKKLFELYKKLET